MTQKTYSNRSGALDLLRLFAAILIYFYHYVGSFNVVYQIVPANLKYVWLAKYTNFGVTIFFMVSGFVVTMTSVNRGIKDFIISRLARLYPLFWVSCIVAFILPYLFYTNHSYLAQVSTKTFLANLTMIPYLLGFPMINPVYHTLMVEMVFYFFIAIVIACRLWNRLLLLLTAYLSICYYAAFQPGLPKCLVFLPIMAGMLFYMIHTDYAEKSKLYTLMCLNFLCAMLCSQAQANEINEVYRGAAAIDVNVYRILMTAVYLLFLLISTRIIHIPGRRFYQMLGNLAYPFYLFHLYFLCFYWFFRNKIQPDVLLAGIFMISIVASWLINVVVEQPLSAFANQALYRISALFKRKKPNSLI